MIPGLLASQVAAALKEFIITGYETETPPFKGEFRRLVEQQGGEALIKELFSVMRRHRAETWFFKYSGIGYGKCFWLRRGTCCICAPAGRLAS